MQQKNRILFLLGVCLIVSFLLSAQGLDTTGQVKPVIIPLPAPKIISFKALADEELANPPKLKRRFIEQGEEFEEKFKFIPKPVPVEAPTFSIPPASSERTQNSPSPSASWNGVMDNSTVIPPDIRGVAGNNHLMQSTNQEFKIYSKSGSLVSTLSIPTFFAATGGKNYFDPHVVYDPNYQRYIVCIAGKMANNNGGIYIGVSQTSDPTGLWYVYSFDGTGNSTDFLDYPLLGFNTNWVVVTGNNFLSSGGVAGKIYVLNRASLYSGAMGTVSQFTDNNVFTLAPAVTYDITQTTEYLVQDWNGNAGGNGYVQICKITGTPNAPVYSSVSLLGINRPWSEYSVNAPQSGSSNRLESGDTRISNALFINGSMWFCHTAYLPATSPTHSGVDWWQINPATMAVQQFGRIEDASGQKFNFFPSISVNSNNDVLVGYAQSSSSTFASAAYSFRAGTDAVNTTQSEIVFKSGVAGYYKTYGGGRNRWGDYTGAAVDPVDNSFWYFGEWADVNNKWATSIVHVPVSGGVVSCAAPSGLSVSNITTNSASLNWGPVSEATSYNLRYRVVGSLTWTSTSSSATSFAATGLAIGSNYEWQVSSNCSSGTSVYSSGTFSTSVGCVAPTSLSVNSITTSSSILAWLPVAGATSYNVRYRLAGSTTWTNATTSLLTYTLSSLAAGSTYEWQVQTVCSSGSSGFTSSNSFNTLSLPCSTPTSMATSNISTNSATISWGGVSGAISYNIRYRAVGSSTWNNISTLLTSYPLSGLTTGASYEWQVQSVCVGNYSSFTGSTNFTTGSATCSTPTGLGTYNVTTSSALATWATVTGASGYDLRYRATGTTTWSTANTTTNYYSLSGLTAGTSYECQVRSNCGSSSSAYSSSVNFTTSAPACAMPSGLSSTSITTTSALCSWTAVSGAVSYTLQYKTSAASTWSSVSVSTTSYTLSSLASGTGYQWQVKTNCSGNSSAFTASSSFTTSAPVCNVPTGLSSSSIGTSSAVLSWGAVSGVINYTVQYRVIGNVTWSNTTTSVNSYTLTGLSSSTAYEWQVRTNCSVGSSAFTSSSNFTTSAAACSTPSGLTTSSVTTTSALCAWTAVSGAVNYTLQYRRSGVTTWSSVTTTGNSYSLTGLSSSSAYEWHVRTNCSATSSAFSSSANFTTSTPVCAMPTGLATTSITNTSASCAWFAVSGAASYTLQYRVAGATSWTNAIVTTNSYSLSGLTAGTSYQWQVSTNCSSSSSSFASPVTFTTSGAAFCSDAFEYNNVSSAAKTVAINTTITGTMGTSTDEDWFVFKTTNSNSNVRITLSNLPADYDVTLYQQNMTMLATGGVRGSGDEILKRNHNKAATYYVRVMGYNGAYNNGQCYSLRIDAGRSRYESQQAEDEISYEEEEIQPIDATPISLNETPLKIYPNPATDQLTVEFTTDKEGPVVQNIYTLSGQRLKSNEVDAYEGVNTQQINTSEYIGGIYFLEIQANGVIRRERFIISK